MHCKNIKAFTLLEILVALAIFIIGSVSIWSLFAVAIDTHNRAIDEQTTILLVESLIAELKDVEIQKGKALAPIRGKSKHYPNYSYDIQFRDLENDAVLVMIEISYQRRGQKQSEKFHTVLFRISSIK